MRTCICGGDGRLETVSLIGEPWEGPSRRKWPVKVPIRKPVKIEQPFIAWPWRKVEKGQVVRTESEVKKYTRPIPDPPCVICRGHGRIKCECCQGRGRTNFIELVFLPKGVWPKWCWYCRGSGLSYCSRCMGTGEKRGMIGFHVDVQDVSSKAKMTS